MTVATSGFLELIAGTLAASSIVLAGTALVRERTDQSQTAAVLAMLGLLGLLTAGGVSACYVILILPTSVLYAGLAVYILSLLVLGVAGIFFVCHIRH